MSNGALKQLAWDLRDNQVAHHCSTVTNLADLLVPGTDGILMDFTDPTLDLSSAAQMIQFTTWCILVIFRIGSGQDVSMSRIKVLVERSSNATLFFIGNTADLDLSDWDRPSLFLEPDSKELDKLHVHSFCGRRYNSFWNRGHNVWIKTSGFVNKHPLVYECNHVLTNQLFRVGYSGLSPYSYKDKKKGQVVGTDVAFMELMAQRYNMSLEFYFGPPGPTDNDWYNSTHNAGKLLNGELEGYTGIVQLYIGSLFFDQSVYTTFSQFRYVTRRPRKILDLANIARGFDLMSWIFLILALASFSGLFAASYYLYKYELNLPALYRNPGNPADFVLMTFCSFVEPNQLTWFPALSTGKFSYLMWSIFSLIMVSFFSSNLRTNLIAPRHEAPINSHSDVLKNDKYVNADTVLRFLKGETLDSDFVEIIRGIDAANAWYRSLGQLPLYLAERVTEYGEVYITTDENLLYSYLFLPNLLGFPHMRMSNDAIYNFYMSLRVPRFSTFTQDMDRLLRMSHEMGLSQKALYDPIPIIALPSTISSSQVINSEVKMSLPMVWAAIFFMIGGAIISTLAFLGEVVVGRCMKNVI